MPNPTVPEGYRGVSFLPGQFRPVKWRGPKRGTFAEAQENIDEYEAENPAASLSYHVLRKGDPDFDND
jgi:hypothetical protein